MDDAHPPRARTLSTVARSVKGGHRPSSEDIMSKTGGGIRFLNSLCLCTRLRMLAKIIECMVSKYVIFRVGKIV